MWQLAIQLWLHKRSDMFHVFVWLDWNRPHCDLKWMVRRSSSLNFCVLLLPNLPLIFVKWNKKLKLNSSAFEMCKSTIRFTCWYTREILPLWQIVIGAAPGNLRCYEENKYNTNMDTAVISFEKCSIRLEFSSWLLLFVPIIRLVDSFPFRSRLFRFPS